MRESEHHPARVLVQSSKSVASGKAVDGGERFAVIKRKVTRTSTTLPGWCSKCSHMPVVNFTNCHCPACKASLDETPSDEPRCPRCNGELDAGAVWATRRYPGLLTLPPWIRAFGWPLGLIALGVGLIVGTWIISEGQAVWLKGPATIIAVGFVGFFVKLFGVDD